MKKLNKLIDELNSKIIVKDTAIDDINKATVRVVKPEKTAELNEFVYSNGNPVKEGTAYHIHYTRDLEEYYMTETNHNKDKSLLIYPKKPLTNFSTYNNLNKQNQMLLKPKSFNPTESDYAKDFVNRTFVRKTNEIKDFLSKYNFELKQSYNIASFSLMSNLKSTDNLFIKKTNNN